MARAVEPSAPALGSLALRFVAGFAVLYALLYYAPFSDPVRDAYCRVLATTTAIGLQALGLQAYSNGASVQMATSGYEIVHECDGLVLVALFVPAVLALRLPKSGWEWSRLGRGVLLLVFLNWIRLVGFGVISTIIPTAAPLAHDFVFQAISITALMVLFLGWAAPRATPEETPAPASGA